MMKPQRINKNHYEDEDEFNDREHNKDFLMQSSNNLRFKKFEPREETEGANDGLDYGKDFSFNPAKFYCKYHRGYEVEFCCEINNTFYCKKCQPEHQEHKDRVLASIPFDL